MADKSENEKNKNHTDVSATTVISHVQTHTPNKSAELTFILGSNPNVFK